METDLKTFPPGLCPTGRPAPSKGSCKQKLREMNPLHKRFGYLSLVGAGLAVLLIGLLLQTDIAGL